MESYIWHLGCGEIKAGFQHLSLFWFWGEVFISFSVGCLQGILQGLSFLNQHTSFKEKPFSKKLPKKRSEAVDPVLHHSRENCCAPPFPAMWGAPRTSDCDRMLLHSVELPGGSRRPNASDSLSVMLLSVGHVFSQKKRRIVLPFRIPECPSSPVGTGPLCKMLREFLLREHQ